MCQVGVLGDDPAKLLVDLGVEADGHEEDQFESGAAVSFLV